MKQTSNIKNKRYQKKQKNRISFSIILTFALVILCSCMFGSSFSSAHEKSEDESTRCKYFKSIQIQEGDSLWSIAKENITEEYASIYEYIEEIAEINQIDSLHMDSIQEGSYLTIAYYDEI